MGIFKICIPFRTSTTLMKVWMNVWVNMLHAWVKRIVVQFVQVLYAFAALVTLISDQVRARRDDRDGKKAVCLQ